MKVNRLCCLNFLNRYLYKKAALRQPLSLYTLIDNFLLKPDHSVAGGAVLGKVLVSTTVIPVMPVIALL